jgi:prolyl oligopeptidase
MMTRRTFLSEVMALSSASVLPDSSFAQSASIADDRPTLAAPDDDPYLWLEEIEGTKALAWAEDQVKRTLQRFGGARHEESRDALIAIYDRPDKIPAIVRWGGLVYNFWVDRDHVRGLWRRTALESYRTAEPSWDAILDLDALAKDEKEDWVWRGARILAGSNDRAILSLSRGGGDAVILREFDLPSKSFVTDGFVLPEAKGGASWLDKDTVLLSSALGPGMATKAGYARTVRLWRRGADPLHAPIIFETRAESVSASGFLDRTAKTERVLFSEGLSFFDDNTWIGDRNGPRTKLDVPTDSSIDIDGDWLLLKTRTAWTIGAITYAPDTLLGIRLMDFIAGSRRFAVLFEAGPRRTLDTFSWCAGQLILAILDNLNPVHEVLTPSGQGWKRETLQGLPAIGVVSVSPLDGEPSESNGELLAWIQDPLTPPASMLLRTTTAPAVLKKAPETFDARGLAVSRHEAISTDGERIPYVQVGRPGDTGDAPVHLTGYGGFQVSKFPIYNSTIGKLWLERGGVSVVANIRGGGEFGPRWHEAGRREGKIKSHDDFAAVAADLVQRGVTKPSRIAAEGGSNGGLLIANMLTRYPERFGALFCTIPLIDMRRYTKLLAGASWIAEYGDPDKPEDWSFLQNYSAYHAAVPGQHYPPILLATSRKDDRVHPGHARKMAAKLQALGYEAYFFEPSAGGHGYGNNNFDIASFVALGLTFLSDAIGWRIVTALRTRGG